MKFPKILFSMLISLTTACGTTAPSKAPTEALAEKTEAPAPEAQKPAEKTDAAPTKEGQISREALVHFCSFMATLDIGALMAIPPAEQQAAVAKMMREAAQEKGIKDWEAFETRLHSLDASQKQPFIDGLVKEHDAAEECKSVK